MEVLESAAFWIGLGTIVWVNLLLSGDNAVVIALAARSLPVEQQRLAVFWGSAGAIVLRFVLTVFAVTLLGIPWLRLIGGLLLLLIGVKLLAPKDDEPEVASHDNLWSAVRIILLADLVMSLDNVIAVAAAAGAAAPGPEFENTRYLLLGLGLSISVPIVILGSVMTLRIMKRFPIIVFLGASLLGWIAGDLMVTDPAVADRIAEQAGWLREGHAASIACALLVVALGTRKKWLPGQAA